MRCFASSKERGAPRCLPAAREVGRGLLVADAVAVADVVVADVVVVATPPGASTVTVTVRRGVGRSVKPHADRAMAATATTHPAVEAARAERPAVSGRAGDRSSMALKSGTGRAAPEA
jgi:hypothetical protein